jgi:hypothetical protein
MTSAKVSDWNTKPLPQQHSVIPIERHFSAAEMKVIKLGVIPEQMDDKWFIYWSRGKLFFHRSWTGFCVYLLEFKAVQSGYTAVRVLANRDPEQYRETSDENDKAMVWFLIDVVLLHRPHPFPCSEPSEGKAALLQWSQVGRAAVGEHPRSNDKS